MEISQRQKEFELLLRSYFLMNDEQVAQIKELVAAQVFAQRAADYEAVKKLIREPFTDFATDYYHEKGWNEALAAIKQVYEQEAK